MSSGDDRERRPGGEPPDAEGFLERWSRLKTRSREDEDEGKEQALESSETSPERDTPEPAEPRILTDEDMPDLESIGEDSDVSGFLSSGVSEALRRKALRKLFLSPKFNIRDGLDDYDDDFRNFESLGNVVTADMRYHAERRIEAMKAAAREKLESNAEPVAGDDGPGEGAGDESIVARAGEGADAGPGAESSSARSEPSAEEASADDSQEKDRRHG